VLPWKWCLQALATQWLAISCTKIIPRPSPSYINGTPLCHFRLQRHFEKMHSATKSFLTFISFSLTLASPQIKDRTLVRCGNVNKKQNYVKGKQYSFPLQSPLLDDMRRTFRDCETVLNRVACVTTANLAKCVEGEERPEGQFCCDSVGLELRGKDNH